jgi:hypothetical protein
MALRGTEPVTNKICVDDRILEQINTFNYLRCYISYEEEKDLNVKTVNIVKLLGIVKSDVRAVMRLKAYRNAIYNIIPARPLLYYGTEP